MGVSLCVSVYYILLVIYYPVTLRVLSSDTAKPAEQLLATKTGCPTLPSLCASTLFLDVQSLYPFVTDVTSQKVNSTH